LIKHLNRRKTNFRGGVHQPDTAFEIKPDHLGKDDRNRKKRRPVIKKNIVS